MAGCVVFLCSVGGCAILIAVAIGCLFEGDCVIRQILFLFLTVILVCGSGAVQAQQILDIFKKDMPKIELLPEEEFVEKTVSQHEMPVGARALSFSIRIPKDWTAADDVSLGSLVISDKIVSNMAKYFGPVSTGVRHRMSVDVIGVTYQMTAKHWFIQYILDNGYSVQGVTVHDDHRVEGLYIFVEDNVSYVVRSVVQLSGKNIVFVQHFLPLEEWHANKVMQAQVLKSFALDTLSTETIEKMKTYNFLDIAEFQYPESWKLKVKAIRSVDRMDAEILNRHEQQYGARSVDLLSGRISFELISIFATQGVDNEIERFKAELTERGLFVQDFMGDYTDFVFEDPDVMAETHVFEMIDKNQGAQEYEFWVTVMAFGDYYYYISLLTPTRESDFLKWSRNTQAYKMTANLFREQPEKEF